MPVTEHLPAGHRELLASKDFHRLLARRWRMSLSLTALLFVLYYGYIILIADEPHARVAPHRRRRRRSGIPLGAAVIVGAWVLTGDLRRLGQPALRPRGRAAARRACGKPEPHADDARHPRRSRPSCSFSSSSR